MFLGATPELWKDLFGATPTHLSQILEIMQNNLNMLLMIPDYETIML